ncbi:hypothetical protein [Fulvivirga lutea]|uniref:Uncharacterized protein n=1 Tax=Fulvivirga lutea TaxID=2810512 RepID=A0A974WFE5_9BACT|nr:hypothetical protein [Fulvivirga lutea]QSE96724.1 hypothetical protein JR347_14130 [Fulvivirga lutea]
MIRYLLYIVLIAIMSGCDTEDSLEPRFEDYFIKYYGDSGDQEGVDFVSLSDGGFVVLGKSILSNSASQIWLTRTDEVGNEIWSNTFGGNQNEDPSDLELDASGNLIISATLTEQNSAATDVMILKVSPDGVKIDSAVFGFPGTSEQINSILVASNQDIIGVGSTENVDINKAVYNPATDLQDFYSIRLNNSLQKVESFLWKEITGLAGVDIGQQLVERPDGSFIYFGTSDDPNSGEQQDGFNMILFPVNNLGDATSTFETQYYGTLGNENATQIINTIDGGYSMVGTSIQQGINSIFTARVRSNINFVSSSNLSLQNVANAASISQSVSGGFLVLGTSNFGVSGDIELIKISDIGSIVWTKSFGGVDNDAAAKVNQAADGSIYILGTVDLESQRKIAFIKTSSLGELKP